MIKSITGLEIHSTKDYERFSFIEGNRKINKANYKKLLHSMQEEQLIIPIIVNERLEIIDGQHRFHACKDLGKPVYYIVVVGYGVSQVKRANTVGTNWSNEDFLQTYITENNENYIAINELKKEFGLQINMILKIVSQFQNKSNFMTVEKFQNGELIIDLDNEWQGVVFFCKQLEMFKPYKHYRTNSFVNAFLKLYMHEDYDPRIMEKQAKWIMNFQPKGNTSEVILEDFCRTVYSYRLTRNQIYYDKNLKRFFK